MLKEILVKQFDVFTDREVCISVCVCVWTYVHVFNTGVHIWHYDDEISSLVVFNSPKQQKRAPGMQLAKGVASKNYNYVYL